jgi:hypothetical protein
MPLSMYTYHAKNLQTSGCSSAASGLGWSPVGVEMVPLTDNLFDPRSGPCFPSPSTGGLGVTVFGLPNIQTINVMLHMNYLQKTHLII